MKKNDNNNEPVELGNNHPGLRTAAKILFVVKGSTVDEIVDMFKNQVSRKTLYNWKKTDGWDNERKLEVGIFIKFRSDLLKVIDKSIEGAIKQPSENNLKLISESFSIYYTFLERIQHSDDTKGK